MRIIIPQDTTDATLVSSSIAENDYPVWNVATNYNRGDFVISTATHTVYRSLVHPNTGVDPDAEQAALADPLIDDPDPVHWQVISATNRWKMFDKKPSVQASASNSITVVLRPGKIWDGIALFNVEAATVQIEVESDADGPVYDETWVMTDETVVFDWYSYFFTPIAPLTEFAVTTIPPYGDSEVTVTITRTGGTVRVGQLVVGGVREIGDTRVANTGFSGLDFSFVQQDEFGDLTTVRRAATRLSQFELWLDNSTLLSFDTLMRQLRGGTAAVWVGSTDARKAAMNYGFYRDYRTVYQTSKYAIVSLQIQGIV